MIPIGKEDFDKAIREINGKLDLILQLLMNEEVEEKRGRGRPPKDK
jgi:hypothetical protein